MIGAVIFDMDGVLADTEPLHARARNQLLTELGLDVEAISPQAIGRGKRDFWSDVARGTACAQRRTSLQNGSFP